MSGERCDVCIVTSSAISSDPRVEKEADALAAAGYRVQVVACSSLEAMRAWDAEIAADKAWPLHAVDWRDAVRKRSLAGLSNQALRRASAAIFAASSRVPPALRPARASIALFATSDRVVPLAIRAQRTRARLYIGHNLAGLAAAFLAARAQRARLGFDAEDDHFGQLTPQEQAQPEGLITDALLHACLPHARFLTAASPGIAAAIARRYDCAEPHVVHNVFPRALRGALDGMKLDRKGTRPGALSLYWYSQSVGLDRGLQDAIRAVALVRGEVELHIRGHAPSDVERALRSLAAQHGIEGRLHFYPQVHPHALLSRSAEHDVGLALEQPVSENRQHAITNKLFFYMLAGLAIAASDTPGQRIVASEARDVIDLYPAGDPAALAVCLQRLHDDRALLAQRKARAVELASTRYCAEIELQKILPWVEAALAGSRS
jgi:hypothetical protein